MSVRASRSMSERGLGEIKWVTIFGACQSMSECYMRKKKHCIWVKKSCDGRDSSKIFSFQHNSVKSQRICFILFEHKSNIIPDISVSLEYSVSAGKQSYIDMRSVGGQLHQFPCLASNIINQFSALCDHRIILEISVSSEYSISPREQVHFHMEDTCTSKSKFGALQAILHCFA